MSTSRRDLLKMAPWSAAALATSMVASPASAVEEKPEAFRFCLNTSTIRGQKLPITEEIAIAAKAGYQGIEPWINELEEYVKTGGKLKDLAKLIKDSGLVVPDAIGFARWIVDDEAERKKGLDDARRAMEMVQEIGGERIAAPPVGATDKTNLGLLQIADRYRALALAGEKMGIVPAVEVWGFSKTLSRLGETVLVAMESGHSKACVLPDVYHLFKGGSDFVGLGMLRGSAIGIFHVNDYPEEKTREKIVDADRVYPGDGVAPLRETFQTLRAIGYKGFLSLELFNREYWKQDALEVARTGLAKMKKATGQE